ncbi:MAG: hypothetical protein AAFR96_05065 [Planctomycetota bacterium]
MSGFTTFIDRVASSAVAAFESAGGAAFSVTGGLSRAVWIIAGGYLDAARTILWTSLLAIRWTFQGAMRIVGVAGLLFVAYIAIRDAVGMLPGYTARVMLTVPERPIDLTRLAEEALFRNLWIASATAFVMVSLAIALRARSFAVSNESHPFRFWLLTGAALLASAVTAIKQAPPYEFTLFFTHARMSGEEPWSAISVRALPRAAYLLAAVPIACFAFACGSLAELAQRPDKQGQHERLEHLRSLNGLLRLGSALLVLGTLMTYSIWSWAVATFDWSIGADADAAATIPRTSAVVGALLWSVLLAVLYIPTYNAVTRLQRIDADRDNKAAPPSAVGSWRAILAIIAPILASLGAPLAEAITKAIGN